MGRFATVARQHVGWLVLGVSVVSVVAGTGTASARPLDVRDFFVAIDVPLADIDTVDMVITQDGQDISDVYCTGLESDPDARGSSVHVAECDLPVGPTYALTIDVPDGIAVHIDCTDIVASRLDPASFTSHHGGGCHAVVAPPGIFVDQMSVPFEHPLVDADGATVTCRDLAAGPRVEGDLTAFCAVPYGTYRFDDANAAPGLISEKLCRSPSNRPPTIDGFNGVVVSAEQPLWACAFLVVRPPASFGVDWSGGENESAPWLADLAIELIDDDGVDRGTLCTSDDIGPFIGGGSVQFDCVGLTDGTYAVGLIGVPDDQTVGSYSRELAGACVTVTAPPAIDQDGHCSFSISSPNVSIDSPPDDDFPDDDVLVETGDSEPVDELPVDELPDTGAPTTVLVTVGLFMTTLGLLLTAGVRASRSGGVRRPVGE